MQWVRSAVRIMLTSLAAAYALLIILVALGERLIYQPHAPAYDMETLAAGAGAPVKTYFIPCRDGRLAAAWLPNPEARFTLLYSHGNGEDMGDDLPILEEFRRAGFAVFAYDYNGYGQSAGRPSEVAVYHDVEAAFDYLTGTLGVPADTVIAFGHSLGAAAAIHLAAHRPVAGLIAQAPFLSAFRVITQVRILPWDRFDNGSTIRRVHCPVLVAHGRQDRVIPFWQGQRIYELANQPKEKIWLDGAGHDAGSQRAIPGGGPELCRGAVGARSARLPPQSWNCANSGPPGCCRGQKNVRRTPADMVSGGETIESGRM